MNKIVLDKVVVCEGRYDKIKLDSVLDAEIITLEGFGIFNNLEKRHLIKALAEKRGVIVVTDSDSAGQMLRGHIKNITGGVGVENVFVPSIEGKEKRKSTRSKEGLLGVEGIDAEVLREIFEKYKSAEKTPRATVSTLRFFEDGFMGCDGAKERREKLAKKLSLPKNMSTSALLAAVNMISGLEEYERILKEI